MKKIIFVILFLVVSVSLLASETITPPIDFYIPNTKTSVKKGIKLWPQITPSIINKDGKEVMNLVIGEDGLTVTDLCWDTYQVKGLKKRWNIDMGEYQTVPLKNYKFDKSLAGLPVSITVELYDPEKLEKSVNNYADIIDKSADTVETYQEILILGGNQEIIDFPKWFSIPTDRLAYDLDENPNWPKDWTLPKGKVAIFQGAAKVRQTDIDGKNPWLRFGFTHIHQHAVSKGSENPDRAQLGGLFYDPEWIDTSKGPATEPESWRGDIFIERAKEMSIAFPVFADCGSYFWDDHQFDAFGKIIDGAREAYPDAQMGCWGHSPIKRSFRVFEDFDKNGKTLGIANEAAAYKWVEFYKHPELRENEVYKKCHLNFGNVNVNYYNNAKPSQLYAFLQEFENSKILKPDDIDCPTFWIQQQFVDGYPQTSYTFKNSKGENRIAYMTHQVPASQIYAISLFGHTVMEGLHCWDQGTYYSENPDDYYSWEIGETPKKISVNGVDDVSCQYYIKYYGFYNYHVLGMWQASRNKDIIEADTKWFMPEYKSSKNNIWRVGDDVYPSLASFHKEPLIRAKLSQDGKELLVVADNPYNTGKETVTIKVEGKEFTFDLAGDWPIIKRLKN